MPAVDGVIFNFGEVSDGAQVSLKKCLCVLEV